jgi:hypothetical protein
MSTVTLNWAAVTTNTDGSPVAGPVTYDIFQGTSASALAKVQSGVAGTSTTVTTGLTPGAEEFFAVTAVAEGQESATSAPASVAIPALVPAAPTGLTATLS